MKFLVDAQLPKSLANFLREKGFDSIHTSQLPKGNDTSDEEINLISISQRRIVISKDGDFYDSFTAMREPYKLLHVKTGNISNQKLIEVFEKNFDSILRELNDGFVAEVGRHYLIVVQ